MATITYKQLYETTFNHIKSICCNVNNVDRLPAKMKTANTKTTLSFKGRIGSSGSGQSDLRESHRKTITYSLSTSVVISAVAESKISEQLSATLREYGIDPTSTKVASPRGLVKFYNVVALFCNAKVRIADSRVLSREINDTKYPIYIENANVVATNELKNIGDNSTIVASDIVDGSSDPLAIIIKTINTNLKGYPIKSNESLSVA